MSAVQCVLMETWPLSGASAVIPCQHWAHTPTFNATTAQYQTPAWVVMNYPRFDSVCTACHQKTIIYASIDHAIAGGWW